MRLLMNNYISSFVAFLPLPKKKKKQTWHPNTNTTKSTFTVTDTSANRQSVFDELVLVPPARLSDSRPIHAIFHITYVPLTVLFFVVFNFIYHEFEPENVNLRQHNIIDTNENIYIMPYLMLFSHFIRSLFRCNSFISFHY